jgi:CubicO group peptidase (beta-lactamase class C family)
MPQDGVSGVGVVRRGGSTVLQWAAGLADRDRALACTRDTCFQIASVSKQFTAAAVLLLLVDRGLLSQPYADFLADRIFAPLGLRSTSAGVPPPGAGAALGYDSG